MRPGYGQGEAVKKGSILDSKWSYNDTKDCMIRLPMETVKEERPKSIPINHHVKIV